MGVFQPSKREKAHADNRGHVDPITMVSLTQIMIVDMPTQTKTHRE